MDNSWIDELYEVKKKARTSYCFYCVGRKTTIPPYVDGNGIGHAANCGNTNCLDKDARMVVNQMQSKEQHQ